MVDRKRPLRAVEAGERAVKAPVTIEEAAERGDDLGELRLTRRVIARKLDDPNCPARDMAALSKRLMEIGREIAALESRDREEAAGGVKRGDIPFDAAAI